MTDEIKYKYSDKRFYVIATILIIMWLGVMALCYLKLDEISKDPCSLCAKRMGSDVKCTIQDTIIPLSMEFYPNGSIKKENYILMEDVIG